MLKDGDTIGLDSTTAAATVESVLSSAAIMVNGGAVRNFTNIINGVGQGDRRSGPGLRGHHRQDQRHVVQAGGTRSDQISDALTETVAIGQGTRRQEPGAQRGDGCGGSGDQRAGRRCRTGRRRRPVQVGDTSSTLEKFPSIAGTDTSGRSVIGDANTIARSWNDLVLAPDTNLAALNRLMPPFIKSTAGNAISVRAGVDRLVLGSIPDAGFGGDADYTGPNATTGPRWPARSSTRCGGCSSASSVRAPAFRRYRCCPAPPTPAELIVRHHAPAGHTAVGAAAMIDKHGRSPGAGGRIRVIDTDCGCRRRVWC